MPPIKTSVAPVAYAGFFQGGCDDGCEQYLYTIICQAHKGVPGVPPFENICKIQNQLT